MQSQQSWGEWVRQCREIAGWSQHQLADLSGVNMYVIQGVESGAIREPDEITRRRLVHAFGTVQALQQQIDAYAPGHELQSTTMLREYANRAFFDRDAAELAQQGWYVMNVETQNPRGCLGGLFGGKSSYRVTYYRTISKSS
jgi:transcriptional regulator with XRE-family HTH domain